MNNIYLNDLKNTINSIGDINLLRNKSIFITGACGLIGSFIVDMLMILNDNGFNIKIIANSRSLDSLYKRFNDYKDNSLFIPYIGDINNNIEYNEHVDFIINCASNTHPVQYSTDPINTILTNIKGCSNVLDFATRCNCLRTILLSSVEIYGENINNIDKFKESDMGYIDCNTLRSGYNESKRVLESLGQAYIENNNLDIVTIRLPRIYGPTVKKDDSKALSQFINKGLNNENIILKSKGEQYFSYLYVADSVSGIFKVLLYGKCGSVYNVAYEKSDIRLKDLAKLVADNCGVSVVFDLPNEVESKGFSKATIARLDYSKIQDELGWNPIYSIEDGINNTIKILKK